MANKTNNADTILSAAFSAEQLSAIREHGFSAAVIFADEPFFYYSGVGECYPLSAIRHDYEEVAEDYKADEINSFEEFIEAATDMGGDLFPTDAFFCYGKRLRVLPEGEIFMREGDEDFDLVLECAEEAADDETAVTIYKVFCPRAVR